MNNTILSASDSLRAISARYAGPTAYEETEQKGGLETNDSMLLDAPPGEVFDAWIHHVWFNAAVELSFAKLASELGSKDK